MFSFDPKQYPTNPGCYLMHDSKGKVIYVGKAKNLRRRLASYFQPRRKHRRTERLVERIASIEVILVNNETEALVLENNLIKLHKPRYNRMLVPDDTGYVYIVQTREALPRFLPWKEYWVNKALDRVQGEPIEKRFGPYPSRMYGDMLLEFVCDNFQLRTCDVLPKRACLLYHLHRCSGPCEGFVSVEEYAGNVSRAVEFLSHPQAELIARMKQVMAQCAERLEFERANRIKEQVHALETMLERQIVERHVQHDQDVIYFGPSHALVMHCESGKLLRVDLFPLQINGKSECTPDAFLVTHFQKKCPAELIVNQLTNAQQVAEGLRTTNGHHVDVTIPVNGEAFELVRLAEMNYAYRVGSL